MTGGVLTIGRLIVTASRAARQAVPEAEPPAGPVQVSGSAAVTASRKTRVLKQVELVSITIHGELPEVPVQGVLCFVEADWPLIGGSFSTRGVEVLWPKKLASRVQQPGALTEHEIERVYRSLAAAFHLHRARLNTADVRGLQPERECSASQSDGPGWGSPEASSWSGSSVCEGPFGCLDAMAVWMISPSVCAMVWSRPAIDGYRSAA